MNSINIPARGTMFFASDFLVLSQNQSTDHSTDRLCAEPMMREWSKSENEIWGLVDHGKELPALEHEISFDGGGEYASFCRRMEGEMKASEVGPRLFVADICHIFLHRQDLLLSGEKEWNIFYLYDTGRRGMFAFILGKVQGHWSVGYLSCNHDSGLWEYPMDLEDGEQVREFFSFPPPAPEPNFPIDPGEEPTDVVGDLPKSGRHLYEVALYDVSGQWSGQYCFLTNRPDALELVDSVVNKSITLWIDHDQVGEDGFVAIFKCKGQDVWWVETVLAGHVQDQDIHYSVLRDKWIESHLSYAGPDGSYRESSVREFLSSTVALSSHKVRHGLKLVLCGRCNADTRKSICKCIALALGHSAEEVAGLEKDLGGYWTHDHFFLARALGMETTPEPTPWEGLPAGVVRLY
ncbi:MAG: hypothetical protein AAB821_02225 [Patescibacteria group bacterium]